MDFTALLIDVVVPYVRAIVFVVSVTWAAGVYLPGVRAPKGAVRSDGKKLALVALALALGQVAAFVGMIREDATVLAKVGDGLIVWALALANRDVVKRALGMSKKKAGAA